MFYVFIFIVILYINTFRVIWVLHIFQEFSPGLIHETYIFTSGLNAAHITSPTNYCSPNWKHSKWKQLGWCEGAETPRGWIYTLWFMLFSSSFCEHLRNDKFKCEWGERVHSHSKGGILMSDLNYVWTLPG